MNGFMTKMLADSYEEEEYIASIQPGDTVLFGDGFFHKLERVIVLEVFQSANRAKVEDKDGHQFLVDLAELV